MWNPRSFGEGDGHLPYHPHDSDKTFQKLRCDHTVQASGMEEDGGSGEGGKIQGTREHQISFSEKNPKCAGSCSFGQLCNSEPAAGRETV